MVCVCVCMRAVCMCVCVCAPTGASWWCRPGHSQLCLQISLAGVTQGPLEAALPLECSGSQRLSSCVVLSTIPHPPGSECVALAWVPPNSHREFPGPWVKCRSLGPPRVSRSEPVGAGPRILCFHKHLLVALRFPLLCSLIPVIPASPPLTVSDGSDTLSLGPQRPPTPCFDWLVSRCPQSASVLTTGTGPHCFRHGWGT